MLSACATNQTTQKAAGQYSEKTTGQLAPSNYKSDLKFPVKVYSLEYVRQHIFENPFWGIQLRYAHIFSPNDILDVYIYPIPATSWEQYMEVLKNETQAVVKEIGMAVKKGHYSSAIAGETNEIDLEGLKGAKTLVEIISPEGEHYQSYIYLFIKQDKFIKLRFSFLKGNGTGLPDSDVLARELVSEISVPKESPFMMAKRNEVKAQRAQQLLQLLMEASKNSEDNNNE